MGRREQEGPGAPWRPDLVETMRFDPLDGIVELERHLARVKASAAALGLTADRHALRNELHAATFRLADAALVRLRIAPDGTGAVATGPFPPRPTEPVPITLAPLPAVAEDPSLRHAVADPRLAEARAAAGTWEVLFVHPGGAVARGSFTSVFVRRGAALLTPPETDALLPGLLRGHLLDTGEAIAARLTAADLRDGFLVGSMAHGLLAATLA